MQENKKAPESELCKCTNTYIIPQNWLDSAYEDFGKSGINRDVTDRYSKSFFKYVYHPFTILIFWYAEIVSR